MYEVNGIGMRIAEKRKAMGLTQDGLAAKLNISAQAVSKWETGLGFPDLTLLPALATILDTSIDALFGKDEKENTSSNEYAFEQTFEGMTLITTLNQQAIYATEAPEKLDDGVATFADGSEANLHTGVVINRGKNRIQIVEADVLSAKREAKKDQKEEKMDRLFSRYAFDLSGRAIVKIEKAKAGDKGGWQADGTESFMQGLTIQESDDTFSVKVKHRKRGRHRGLFQQANELEGNITVFVPADSMPELDVFVRGSTTLQSAIDHVRSRIEINGGASIALKKAGNTHIMVNGAGKLKIDAVDDASIAINGSGNINIKDASGKVECQVNGAGKIALAGNLDELTVNMNGSGKLKGDDLVVHNLDVDLGGVSVVAIKRLTGESRERLSKMSKLKIGQRG